MRAILMLMATAILLLATFLFALIGAILT